MHKEAPHRKSLGTAAHLLAILLASAAAAPGAVEQPIDRIEPGQLKPGEYLWHPERSAAGPVLIAVSLSDQLAYVYRNGIRIGTSSISSGRPGHLTPTGVFTILEKQKDHESTIYKGAKMPFMERLTWDGIALHAGKLPGYPASHGCIRLPLEFSKLLYQTTTKGGTVVIVDGKAKTTEAIHPGGLLAPDLQKTAASPATAQLEQSWHPEASPSGPVSILLSGANRRIYVYRNGILIGQAAITIAQPERPLGDRAYVMLDGFSDEPNRWVPGKPSQRWSTVQVSGSESDAQDLPARIGVPPDFARQVYGLIVPGTALYVTDAAATPDTRTDPGFTIVSTEEAAPAGTAQPKREDAS